MTKKNEIFRSRGALRPTRPTLFTLLHRHYLSSLHMGVRGCTVKVRVAEGELEMNSTKFNKEFRRIFEELPRRVSILLKDLISGFKVAQIMKFQYRISIKIQILI